MTRRSRARPREGVSARYLLYVITGRRVASSPLEEILERAHTEFAPDSGGRVATYIPELGESDPETFGIAVATVDGEVFGIGDANHAFTIQSISKPLVFGMALEERGRDDVLGRVGVEPSGNPFNSVTVDPRSSRPFNPMVNAGAIVTTALIGGTDPSERMERILETFSRFAGRPLTLDQAVLASERETGDRNRALAWLMRSFGMLDSDVDEVVDLYFAQCSILVTCRDLAVMGATLANGGRNPITGERAIDPQHVTNVLSVMSTCGMYDNAGEWLYNVGLPAKSGVAGGVLAVLPGQLGIGVFSPPLDDQGNSVRGVRVCERLSHELQLHLLGRSSGVRSVVRRALRGDEIASSRVRTVSQEDALATRRRALGLYELQGELFFATAEKVHRTIAADIDDLELVIVDFTHVSGFDEPALAVLNRLAEELARSGRTAVAVCGSDGGIDSKLQTAMSFLDADTALEWCEDRLLGGSSAPVQHESHATLERFDPHRSRRCRARGDRARGESPHGRSRHHRDSRRRSRRRDVFLALGANQCAPPTGRDSRRPEPAARDARTGRRLRGDGVARRGDAFGRRGVRRAIHDCVAVAGSADATRGFVPGDRPDRAHELGSTSRTAAPFGQRPDTRARAVTERRILRRARTVCACRVMTS